MCVSESWISFYAKFSSTEEKSINWEKDTKGCNWFKINKNNTDYLVGRNMDREIHIKASIDKWWNQDVGDLGKLYKNNIIFSVYLKISK